MAKTEEACAVMPLAINRWRRFHAKKKYMLISISIIPSLFTHIHSQFLSKIIGSNVYFGRAQAVSRWFPSGGMGSS
jgi:hypothetical protein